MVAAKNTVYYVVIISGDPSVQLKSRRAISRMLPQAIVESLTASEAVRFICQAGAVPDLIMLDLNEQQNGEIDLVQLIHDSDSFSKVPLVILSDENYRGTYEKPGRFVQAILAKSVFQEVNMLLSSLKEIWFTTPGGKKIPGILQS